MYVCSDLLTVVQVETQSVSEHAGGDHYLLPSLAAAAARAESAGSAAMPTSPSPAMQRELASLVYSDKAVHHRRGVIVPAKYVSPSYRFMDLAQQTAYDWKRPMMGEMVSPHKRHGKPRPGPHHEWSRPRSTIDCLSPSRLPTDETPKRQRPHSSVNLGLRPAPQPAGLPRAPPAKWPKWGAPPPERSESSPPLPICAERPAMTPPVASQSPSSRVELGSLRLSHSTSSLASTLYKPLSTLLYIDPQLGAGEDDGATTPVRPGTASEVGDIARGATGRGPQPEWGTAWSRGSRSTPTLRPRTAASALPKPSWWGHVGSRSILDGPLDE